MRVKCLVQEYTDSEKAAYDRLSDDSNSKVQRFKDANEDWKKRLAADQERLKNVPPEQQLAIQRRIGLSKLKIDANNKQINKLQVQKAEALKDKKTKVATDVEKAQKEKSIQQAEEPPKAGVADVAGQAAQQAATGALTTGDWRTAGTIGLGALAVYGAWKAYKHWKKKREEAKTDEDKKQAEEKMAKEREKIRKEREKK